MTRRSAFLAVGVGLAAVALWLFLRPWQRLWRWAEALRPRLDASSPSGSLSEQEMKTVLAFGEVLVAGAVLPPAERGYLAEHIDDRTQRRPGYLSLYRATADTLDRLAQARFAALAVADRVGLMLRYRLTVPEVRAREHLLPFRRRELAIRALAVPDLIAGYYASPAGWGAVGYAVFPGRCSDLVRYTRAEASRPKG